MTAEGPVLVRPLQGDAPALPADAETQGRGGLRSKLSKAFLLQAAAITCGTILGIYAASTVLEDVLIKRALTEEAQHYLKLLDANPGQSEPDTHNMRGYLRRPGQGLERVPVVMHELDPGFHTVRMPDSRPLVYVNDSAHGRLYLSFDQQHVSKLVLLFGIVPLMLVLIFIYVATLIAYRISKRAVSPVVWLANVVRSWDPRRPDNAALAPEKLPDDFEGESQVLGDALYAYSSRIAELIERERTFTRDASHELRSPLTVIKIATDVLLADGECDAFTERNLKRIQQASRDMESLIEAFLILARDADSGMPCEEFLINTVLREEVERATPLLSGKEVQIRVEEHAQLLIEASAKVVGVLLGNLVRNACNYTERGSVVATVHADRVEIADTGCGMSEAELAQVFQAFYRVSGTNKGGHGVGLAIVKRLSERFGWPVQMQSSSGVGTRVSVHFPQAKVQPEPR